MADLPYSPDGFPLISNLADPLLPPRLPDDVTAGWMTPPTNHGGWADSQWNADNTNFWSLPVGASPDDILAGYDELGNPIYQTITGQRYQLNAAPQKQGSVVRALAETAMNQPVIDSIGAVAKALAQGAWDTFSLPGRAAAGEPVTYADVRDFVGDYGVMSAFGAAPEGSLRSGAIRTADDLPPFYHVAPDDYDPGTSLTSLYRRMGDDAYEEFARRWPDGADMADYHANAVFMFDDPKEALQFQDWKGGRLLGIRPEWLDDLKYDNLEIPVGRNRGYPYFQDEIPSEWISEVDANALRAYLESLP